LICLEDVNSCVTICKGAESNILAGNIRKCISGRDEDGLGSRDNSRLMAGKFNKPAIPSV
jgi:hypothetical protein